MFPVNKSGLGLQNPVTSAEDKYTSLLLASYELIGAVKVEKEFSTADHLLAFKEERWDGKTDQGVANDVKLRKIVSNKSALEKRPFLCAKNTGSWMSVQGTMINGTVLTATESREFLCACYKVNPPNL